MRFIDNSRTHSDCLYTILYVFYYRIQEYYIMWTRKMNMKNILFIFSKQTFAYLFLSGIFFYQISGFTYYYTRILYSRAHIIITITKIIVQSFEFFPVKLNIIYTSLWCPNRPEIRIFSNPHNLRGDILYGSFHQGLGYLQFILGAKVKKTTWAWAWPRFTIWT